MDHYQRSLHNLFTASPLDRAEDRRRDEHWLAARQTDPSTCFTLIWQFKHLVAGQPPIRPVFLSPQELHERVNGAGSPTFLGLHRDRAYFAADLPASMAVVPEGLAELGQFQELRQVAALLDAPDAAILAHARAMAYWHQRHRFCGDCGSPTESREGGYVRVCSNAQCGQHHFPRSDPAIIVLVESGNRCLLGRKASWPDGQYSTIAGFVEPGECIEGGDPRGERGNGRPGRRNTLPILSTVALSQFADAGVQGPGGGQHDPGRPGRTRRRAVVHARGYAVRAAGKSPSAAARHLGLPPPD